MIESSTLCGVLSGPVVEGRGVGAELAEAVATDGLLGEPWGGKMDAGVFVAPNCTGPGTDVVSKPTRAFAEASSSTGAVAADCEALACPCNPAMGCDAVCGVVAEADAASGADCDAGASFISSAVAPFVGNVGAC